MISIMLDILSRSNYVCGKVKLIMCCYCNNCDPLVRLKLLQSYSCDLYGYELYLRLTKSITVLAG